MTSVLGALPKPNEPVYDPGDFYDEALTPDGRPRPAYEEVLAPIAHADLTALAARARQHLSAEGVTFGTDRGALPFHVDPVPRVFERSEWDLLETRPAPARAGAERVHRRRLRRARDGAGRA